MAGGSIRAAAMVGGYRSATAVRRAVLPSSSQPPHSSSAADGHRASTIAMDGWVIPDREAFDAVPTHDEAMEATLELRDAFEIAKSDPKMNTKVGPVSALLEVHSETPLEDSYENVLLASGAPVRVVQGIHNSK